MVDEELADPFAIPHLAHQWLVGGYDPPHLFLDCGQVFFGELTAFRGRGEVVIEAVVSRRTESDLRPRKQILHRLGEHVREVVPNQLERILLVTRRDQREARVALERAHDVAHLAVNLGGKRGLGQPRTDRGGNVRGRRTLGHFPH